MITAQTQAAPAPAPGAATPATSTAPQAAPSETPDAPSDDNPDLSRRFAMLTKRERQILERDKQIKDREKAANERWSAVEAYENAKKDFERNPFAIIEALGHDKQKAFRMMSEFILNDEKPKEPTFEETAKSRIERLEKQLEAEAKAKEEEAARAAAEEEESIISNYKAAITEAMSTSDAFEFTAAHGDEGMELAYNIAWEHYLANNEIMPPQKALELAENYIESQIKERFTKTKKFAKLMEGLNQTPNETKPPAPEVKHQDSDDMTLTNRAVAESSSYRDAFDHLEDDEASKRRAAEFLKGQLSK